MRERCSPGPLRGARGAARGDVFRILKGQDYRDFFFASGGTVNTPKGDLVLFLRFVAPLVPFGGPGEQRAVTFFRILKGQNSRQFCFASGGTVNTQTRLGSLLAITSVQTLLPWSPSGGQGSSVR